MTRLSGRVPETGTAISGATVAIIDTQGTDDTTQWSIVASDTTDANGEWSVSGLEPSAVERYHAVAQFDSGVEFVNFESLPYLSTPADAFAPTTPVNVGTPTAEVGIPAFFDVTITNTNTPVDEGDILTVDFNANNTGTFQDTQDIRLEIDNVEEDRDNNVTLDGGVSTTGTLQWDTTNETPAQYTATVLSNDDANSVTVQVESAIPDSGLLHDHYPSEITASDGDSVTTLPDPEGNEDASGSGTFVEDWRGTGESAITLNPSNSDAYTASGVSVPTDLVVFQVWSLNDNEAIQTTLSDSDSDIVSRTEFINNTYRIQTGVGDSQTGGTPQSGAVIYTLDFAENAGQMRVNGTQVIDHGNMVAEDLNGLIMGTRAGAGEYVDGDLARNLVYDKSQLSSIRDVEDALNEIYGVY